MLVVGGWMACLPARGATRAEEAFAEGLAYHRQAEATASGSVAVELLKQAIGRYRVAVEADPQFYPAQSMWGIGLTQLAELETNRTARTALVREARERIRVAAACPNADARAEQHWGNFLIARELAELTEPGERRALLEEARTALEAALRRTPTGASAAGAHALLGHCFALLSDQTTNVAERVPLLRLSREHYEAMAQADPKAGDTTAYRGWGYVLMQLYRQESDPALLTEAVTRFEAAHERAPQDPVVSYKLACVLALLGRHAEAMKKLTHCFDHDPQLVFFASAEQDADLVAVRALPEYRARAAAARAGLAAVQANQLTNTGAALQREAESLTNDLARAVALWQDAIAHYRAAVEKQPGNTRANFLWAISLVRLLYATSHPADVRLLAEQARERFAIAAAQPQADVAVHEQRALFLGTTAARLATNAAQRVALLREAREAFTQALRDAPFTGQRARLSSQFGSLLLQLAEASPPTEKRTHLREALTHFEATRKVENLTNLPEIYDHWGIALLRLGQLDRNSMHLRLAVERFQSALELSPDRLESRYNLACAYALLNQPASALRHLRQCLDHDTNGVFRAGIQTDPDLATVRDTAEYRDWFGPPSVETLVEPKLKGQ